MSLRRLVLLTAEDVAAARVRAGRPDILPYRLDLLRSLGWEVEAFDAVASRRRRVLGTVSSLLDRFLPPSGPTLSAGCRLLQRETVVVAVFESQGHLLALLRAVLPMLRRRGRLVVVMCWLAELLPDMAEGRRRLLRFAYRGVDDVLVFSGNQVDLLQEHLGLPRTRVHSVPFGIDVEEFPVSRRTREPFLLAVGRDRGRDWVTTFEAVRGTGIRLKVLCRPQELGGLDLPDEVEVLGYVDRQRYRKLVQTCTALLLLTRELAYPTGQSVLLEAMSSGTACVVTSTPALSEYLRPGETALTVPVGDAGAARRALLAVFTDEVLRQRLGDTAAAEVRRDFSAAVMCHAVDERLRLPARR